MSVSRRSLRAAQIAVASAALCFCIAPAAQADDKSDLNAAFARGEQLIAKQDYAAAALQFERALALAPRVYGPNTHNVAVVKNNLAVMYKRLGRFADAERQYLDALAIDRKLYRADDVEIAIGLNNLGALYEITGQYTKAEEALQQAVKIYEAKRLTSDPRLARSLSNLGAVYQALGQNAKAEPLLLRGLAIKQAAKPKDFSQIAETSNHLGILYHDLGQYEKARNYHTQALTIRKSLLGADHPDVAASLTNLANLYKIMDVPDGLKLAAEHYQAALDIELAKLGPEHIQTAATYHNLGMLYHQQDKLDLAEQHYLKALPIYEKHYGPQHPKLARQSLSLLARLSAEQGKFDKAAGYFDRARKINRLLIARVLPAFSEAEQLAFLKKVDQYELSKALALGLVTDDAKIVEMTAEWLLNGKAVAQQSLAERQKLAQETAIAGRLAAVRLQRAGLAGGTTNSAQKQKLAQLADEEQQLIRQLGRPLTADPWVDLASVRQTLTRNSVLIDMACIDVPKFARTGPRKDSFRRYVAWVIPAEGRGPVKVIDLGPEQAINDAVKAFQTAMAAAQSSDAAVNPLRLQGEAEAEKAILAPLSALSKLVLDPLPQVVDADDAFLSPDGSLWLVPWAALPLKAGKDGFQYAIDWCHFRYLVSGRDLVSAKAAAAQTLTSPLVFANPDFDLKASDAAAATRDVMRKPPPEALALRGVGLSRSAALLPRVARLPGTAAEAKLIAPHLEKMAGAAAIDYSDRFALEGVFKSIHSPRVLVMATHGYFLPQQAAKPEETSAAPSKNAAPPPSAPLDASGAAIEDPLLRCGLLLAGCNDRGPLDKLDGDTRAKLDDGILTGREIAGCDLRGTELVVLSACETGLGDVNIGEGVAGLRQAFQLAGAKSVVSTLWQIPDQDTAQLMDVMFTRMAAGDDKAAALRMAQLALIKHRRERHGAAHPLYWAAFTLTGK